MGTHPIFESDFDCLTDWEMDFVESIKNENTKAEKGLDEWYGLSCASIDQIDTQIDELLRRGQFDDEEQLKRVMGAIRGDVASLAARHKSLHGPVSKMGRLIDKHFNAHDFNPVGVANVFDECSRDELTKAIVDHLYCSGMSPVADQLQRETKSDPMGEEKRDKTRQLAQLIDDIRKGDCQQVLAWLDHLRVDLGAYHGRQLEWKVKRLKFCQRLKKHPQVTLTELLELGRGLAACATTRHQQNELAKLMTAILYRAKLEKSQYWALVEKCLDSVPEMCEDLKLAYGQLHNMPELNHEHLMYAHAAGCIALPDLSGIRSWSLMWSASDELPIEVTLPRKLRFHSIFSCPIFRKQTTDKNPPKRLKCGHAISKDALDRLQNNSRSRLIKCPYCPVESKAGEAEQCYF